jgi:Fe(3+) dicitrate transport protein
MNLKYTLFLWAQIAFVGVSIQATAQSRYARHDSMARVEMPQIQIISKKNSLLNTLPGSVGTVGSKELEQVAPVSGNEIFRRISGIHVVDEEGAGLRMNLSIRGLDPDRSRSVLVLEDGVPVSLNPYGEPELYYTPLIDRMAGVEVLKGSGQLLFGPQTIGGVVNYITKDPSLQPEGRVKLTVGDFGYISGLASYGATYGNVGVQVNYAHKQASNLGYTQFNVHDFSTKLKFKFSEKSTLGVKLGYYTEQSNATYIGLTQQMYASGNQDFVLMAPDDNLNIRRTSISATHHYRASNRLQLNTTMYAYTTDRDWQRQDFSTSKTASNLSGVVWGDTAIAGGAIYMRNQNGHRNRAFAVLGVEPRLKYEHQLFSKQAELQAGVRFHTEQANEQRINGKKADAQSGDLVEDELRTGNALSAFVQQTLTASKYITFNAGARVEYYDYNRNIYRNTFTIGGTSSVRDTNIQAGQAITSVLPGVGMNLNMSKSNTVFAGIHRGFAPPRVKDAISNQGEVYLLEAEQSWNMEIGTRGRVSKLLEYEVTLFRMDFSNQIIPVAESAGGTGSGLVNGGKTLHQGIEGSYVFHIGQLWHSKTKYVWKSNATFTQATFSQDRFIKEGTSNVNINGNRTPYAPKYTVTSALSALTAFGLGAQATATFTGMQYTDMLNTVLPSADGRIGQLPAYQLWDASVFYTIPKTKVTFNVALKNITNERYISSRRPQGVRVGNPRFISAGIDVTF